MVLDGLTRLRGRQGNSMRHVVLAVVAFVGLAAGAGAQDWRVETLGGPAGWEIRELGNFLVAPETSSVRVRYESKPLSFMYGCERGQILSLQWLPSRPVQAASGAGVPVAFSINGASIATLGMRLNNNGKLQSLEAGGVSTRILEAVDAARKGVLVVSAGGVSDSVPFDETLNGGAAEYVLSACAN